MKKRKTISFITIHQTTTTVHTQRSKCGSSIVLHLFKSYN